MAIPSFNLVPGRLDVNAVVGNDFTMLLDFDIDLTGYTFDAQVILQNLPANTNGVFTVTPVNLVDGRISINLTDTQTKNIGPLSNTKWYFSWSVGGNDRTVLSGKFTLNQPWAVGEYTPTSSPVTVTIDDTTVDVTVIGGAGGSILWGDIQGNIEDQTDLIEYISDQINDKAVVVNVKSYGAKGDGVTDDTAAIQNALDNETYLFFPDTGNPYIVSEELLVPSNRTIVHAPTATLKKKNFTTGLGECEFYRNSDYDSGNSNITITGGIFDGNNANQTRTDNNPDQLIGGVGFRFKFVSNLTLSGITVKNPLSFSFQIGKVRDVTIRDISFVIDYITSNQDGVHFNGDVQRVYVRNLRGSTTDDILALNADDYAAGSFEMTVGDIEDITVDGIFSSGQDGFRNGVRLLVKESYIKNVTIKNVYAVLPDEAFIMDHYMEPLGTGRIQNLTLENWYITKQPGEKSAINVDNNYDNLTIRNFHLTNQATSGTMGAFLYQPAGDGKNLVIENCSITETNNTASVYNGMFFQAGCYCDGLIVDGFTYRRLAGSAYSNFQLIWHEGILSNAKICNIDAEYLDSLLSLLNQVGCNIEMSNLTLSSVNSVVSSVSGYFSNLSISNLVGSGVNILKVTTGSTAVTGDVFIVNSRFSGTNILLASGAASSPIELWSNGCSYSLSGAPLSSSGNPLRLNSLDFGIDKALLTPTSGDIIVNTGSGVQGISRYNGSSWITMASSGVNSDITQLLALTRLSPSGQFIQIGTAGVEANPSGLLFDTDLASAGCRLFRFSRSGSLRFDFGYDPGNDRLFFSNGTDQVFQFGRDGTLGVFNVVTASSFEAYVNDFLVRASGKGVKYGASGTVRDTYGAGSPEGSVTADAGSTYRDITNGFLYEKITGTGNTGWVNSIQTLSSLGAAPSNATYIVQTASSELSSEQALGDLSTGLLKNTTTTGVLTIAVAGTDYITPSGDGSGLTNLNAGSLASGTVPAARGGAGTINGVMQANGSGVVTALTASAANQYLRRNADNSAYEFAPKTDYLTYVPGDGEAIEFTDNPNDQVFYINPAGDLTDLQLILPLEGFSVNGQKVTFCITKNIATFSFTGATTIYNNPTSITAGECFQFYKVASNVWARVM